MAIVNQSKRRFSGIDLERLYRNSQSDTNGVWRARFREWSFIAPPLIIIIIAMSIITRSITVLIISVED